MSIQPFNGAAPSTWKTPSALAMMISSGAVFGYAMNKGQVHLPHVIQDQMTFQQFTMMKMFLAALGTSMVSKSIFRAIQPQTFDAMRTKRASDPSHAAVLITGGLILGSGMTISGSCPGSVYVQLGAQIPSSPIVFGGVLVGNIVAGIVKPWIQRWQEEKPRVNSIFSPSWPVHALFGCLIVGTSVILEVVTPEKLYGTSWLPTISGVVVGSVQFPLAMALSRSLGVSASYKIMVGHTKDKLDHIFGCSLSWLQIPLISDLSVLFFALGTIAGSAIAYATSPATPLGPLPTPAASVVGGALIGLGASIAGGLLPSIFAGAIATAFIF
ncbi:hypothetical protein AeRB84_002641 [Aphanomyces euteiches]|nr:hypothetical protein AeRB84_002641 [Aphanomyces euteiches]